MSPRKLKTKILNERIAELEESLENEKKNSEKILIQLKYARADLENLQKRTQKTIDDAKNRSNGRILYQLLPILDELDLAIKAGENLNDDLIDGVKMIRGKLWKILDSMGITEIEAFGHPFNPNLHEAVLEVESSEVKNGYILEELRKGYKFKDAVLRASMVKVAKNFGSINDKEDNEDE
jgi:molecular chaperone GrpE